MPSSGQRTLHAALLEQGEDLPPAFDHWLAPRAPGAVTVEAATGIHGRGRGFLEEGQVIQRLFQAFATNRYARIPLAELHEAVFAGEYFSPKASSDRIHQALRRLRAWLRRNRVPLLVIERLGFYGLEATSSCALRVRVPPSVSGPPGDPAVRTRIARRLALLARSFGAGEFAVSEAARVLRVSTDSALLYLREALEGGLAQRSGAGPATRYRLIRPEP